MAINSKKKGNSAERVLAKTLNDRFNTKEFLRVPQSGAITGGFNRAKAEGYSDDAKELLSGDLITPKKFLFSIESKSYADIDFWDLFNASSNLKSWMKQCQEDADFAKKKPMLVVKINRHKTMVFIKEILDEYVFEIDGWKCLYLDDLLKKEDDFFMEKITV